MPEYRYRPEEEIRKLSELVSERSSVDDIRWVIERLDNEPFRELLRLYCAQHQTNVDYARLCRSSLRTAIHHTVSVQFELSERKERGNTLKLGLGSIGIGSGSGVLLGVTETLLVGGLVSLGTGATIFVWGEVERRALSKRLSALQLLRDTLDNLLDECGGH